MWSAASQAERTRAWTALLCAAWAGLTAWLALARYLSFHNQTFDLALYARMAWGVAHGELWDPILGGQFFGGHMPLVLLPLGLLGRLFGTVPVLLIAQSVCVALAALPIARIAERRLGACAGGWAALGFLLYPNLGHVATYEFHPGTLALWPLAHALDALDRQQPRALLWLCAAVLACRASLALQTLMLGLLGLRGTPAMRRAGLLITLASLAYFACFLLWQQPLHGDAAPSSGDLHFGKWGGSPFGVFSSLLRDPQLVAQHFLAPARVGYPLLILAPLALLPLLQLRLLLVALPVIAQNLVSAFPTSTELYSHYLTPAVPALFVAGLEGLASWRSRTVARPQLRRAGTFVTGCAIAAGSVLYGGLPWSRDFRRADFARDAGSASASAALVPIGTLSSVQAPDALLSHLAERRSVHRAPPPERATEFVVLDCAHRRRFAHSEDLLRTVEEPLLRHWLARSDHQLVLAQGDLLVLQRGLPARGGIARSYFVGTVQGVAGTRLTNCLTLHGARLHELQLSLQFVAHGACAEDLAIRLGGAERPSRVDLLCDGLLSPARFEAGDLLRSNHLLTQGERAAILAHGLHLGTLRSSGAPPDASDPIATEVPLQVEP